MAQRATFLEHVSDHNNNASQRSRPVLIPRQISSFHVEGPTSVTEETFSSSHSSESYIPADEHSLSTQSSQLSDRQHVYQPNQQHTDPESSFRVGSNISQLSGIVGGSAHGVSQRKRPSFARGGSSYSRGSFVGKNGSFISTSLGDDIHHTVVTEPSTSYEPGAFSKVVPATEFDEDLAEPDATVEDLRDTNSAPSDRETTVMHSVPKNKPSSPHDKPQRSRYFQEIAQKDDFLQQYSPFHNTPTSVSSSYGTNKSVNYMMQKRQADEIAAEPKLSEDPELIEIANFPTDRLLDMLTALLDKIVQSNDLLHQDRSPNGRQPEPQEEVHTRTYSMGTGMSAELLSFRGKHVPAITLKQYFQRIQKYCPTTNDVFLSLLVYFDRIAKACNNGKDQLFVMDSLNIHRLIISAVTVSTKFFSDFFYSNSRYARVGGISLKELNYLELQFLILCDFELIISVEELQKYGVLLRDFWQREEGEADPSLVL
ncbi:LAME_0G18756g1_1 [Lachancea meyersii CBS 8951]|uniref:LAME_0G18756g1_1 n=1 Tax=Lachancea meyersii CBS 8951 TaxID=1266667 RepID=A0A1G4KC65_9SACH|nr:LAME_0G18756g1_1 [Lachancea meyersii CBS 8951]